MGGSQRVEYLPRRVTGRHETRDDDRVGVVETGAELLKQGGEPRVAVRLHDGDDVALGRFPRRSQHGGNLDRVVAVIVDDGGAIPHAGARKAPPHAAEIGQRMFDHLVADAELMGDRDRRRGVERIMASRHRERDGLDLVQKVSGAIAELDP